MLGGGEDKCALFPNCLSPVCSSVPQPWFGGFCDSPGTGNKEAMFTSLTASLRAELTTDKSQIGRGRAGGDDARQTLIQG